MNGDSRPIIVAGALAASLIFHSPSEIFYFRDHHKMTPRHRRRRSRSSSSEENSSSRAAIHDDAACANDNGIIPSNNYIDDNLHQQSNRQSTTTSSTGSDVAPGTTLASVLKSQGPVVSCVLLRHGTIHNTFAADDDDDDDDDNDDRNKTITEKPAFQELNKPREDSGSDPVVFLEHLIEEVAVDTTPNAQGVQQILGGPFTFVGQFPTEGVIVMARSDQMEDEFDVAALNALNNKELRYLGDKLLLLPLNRHHPQPPQEKADLIRAIVAAQLPINPHKLQPPLHRIQARGDLLLMRVGGEQDNDDDDASVDVGADSVASAIAKAMADMKQATAVPNEEFFLNYTKQEYLQFAARTDIVTPPEEDESYEEEDDEQEAEDEDDEQEAEDDEQEGEDEEPVEDEDEDGDDDVCDEDFDPVDDMTLDELQNEKPLLLNLILGEVLREFRELNKRGPNSEELLDLRQKVADKIDYKLTPPPSPMLRCRKRAAATRSRDHGETLRSKRVKFDPQSIQEEEEDNNEPEDTSTTKEMEDQKPAALLADDSAVARKRPPKGPRDGIV